MSTCFLLIENTSTWKRETDDICFLIGKYLTVISDLIFFKVLAGTIVRHLRSSESAQITCVLLMYW
jgi:hypothetical protein